MKPLRVLQIGPIPPPWGGVESNLEGIHHYLSIQGHQSARLNVTRHRRANEATAYFPHSPAEVLRLLWTLPHDILHLHVGGSYSRRLQALSLALTSIPGKRSVLSFHSGGYPGSAEGQSARRWGLRSLCWRRFDRLIVVNEEMQRYFAGLGVAPSRCRLILPYWLPEKTEALSPGLWRGFFEQHSPVILSVSGMEPEYDLPTQLLAFEQVLTSLPRAGLLWIGSGSQEQEMRQRVAQSPAAESIAIAGDVPRPQVLAAIARADVFWRTTLYDGDAISIREALHFGTPVIATNNGMRPPGVALIALRDAAALTRQTLDQLRQPRPAPLVTDGYANLRAIETLYRELA